MKPTGGLYLVQLSWGSSWLLSGTPLPPGYPSPPVIHWKLLFENKSKLKTFWISAGKSEAEQEHLKGRLDWSRLYLCHSNLPRKSSKTLTAERTNILPRLALWCLNTLWSFTFTQAFFFPIAIASTPLDERAESLHTQVSTPHKSWGWSGGKTGVLSGLAVWVCLCMFFKPRFCSNFFDTKVKQFQKR